MLSTIAVAAVTLALQGPSQMPPSPVKRIEVRPSERTITAGDSIRLDVLALDAEGKPLPDAVLWVRLLGGSGEGMLRPESGYLVASNVGKFPLGLSAVVPGTQPFVDTTSVEFDAVPGPAVRVELAPKAATIVAGQTLALTAIPFSKANDRAHDRLAWKSGAPRIVSVDEHGVITGVAPGKAKVTASADGASGSIEITVASASIAKLTVSADKSRVRQGDVVAFAVDARPSAGKPIAGLTPTWSFSPGDGQIDGDGRFVAYRTGVYTISATLGHRSASTTIDVAERDVKRSVTVVGRLPRTEFATSEVWIHPNGKVAYLGTHQGGDRVYSIDISDPARPVVVDSIQANTRLVNDMQTTADGSYMVFTREGAADRKNGIVIADTRNPLHPKEIAQFVDGVASGVHSIYLYETPQYGRYLYLTNDGTGAVDIVNLDDPAQPRRVGEWMTDRPDAARYVHDIDILDGLMYASYWNDGLVVLDIGNGKWGGRPDKPVLVSQFKYDLDSLYKDVEDVTRRGYTRGTHTAWRQRGGKYVFIADEVYLNGGIAGARDASASRMYGTMQVVDVSDLEHPRSVAWYTPEHGGVHNLWQVADTLYMGAYDAGYRVFDISGELKGDLRAQRREIAALSTADMGGFVQNSAFTWGVVVNPKDGLAYVNDFNNGLWVVRVNPKESREPLVP